MAALDAEAAIAGAVFNSDGLVPAVIQQADGPVLMLGWMDAEAMRRTFSEGVVTFWSRSRREYWRKGDTSGHRFFVTAAAFDCDADALLVTVQPVLAACHTGAHSCFEVVPISVTLGSTSA